MRSGNTRVGTRGFCIILLQLPRKVKQEDLVGVGRERDTPVTASPFLRSKWEDVCVSQKRACHHRRANSDPPPKSPKFVTGAWNARSPPRPTEKRRPMPVCEEGATLRCNMRGVGAGVVTDHLETLWHHSSTFPTGPHILCTSRDTEARRQACFCSPTSAHVARRCPPSDRCHCCPHCSHHHVWVVSVES